AANISRLIAGRLPSGTFHDARDQRKSDGGHSRGLREYSDRPEMPVPLSAPGVSRTPDLQVRALCGLVRRLKALRHVVRRCTERWEQPRPSRHEVAWCAHGLFGANTWGTVRAQSAVSEVSRPPRSARPA